MYPPEAVDFKQTVLRDTAGVCHFVPVSGGKDSTCTALWLQENEPRPYNYVCTPTGDELPDMVEHWRTLGKLLGREVMMLPAPTLNEVIASEKALPNFRMRFCTPKIKLRPFRKFVTQHAPAVIYVGLRVDEESREGASDYGSGLLPGMEIRQRYPLREAGMDVEAVWAFLGERGVVIPKRTDCAKCFYQKLGEWYELYRDHPDRFAEAEADEARYEHTYRSPGRDSWPAALADLRVKFAAGEIPERSLRMMEGRRGMCRVCSL